MTAAATRSVTIAPVVRARKQVNTRTYETDAPLLMPSLTHM